MDIRVKVSVYTDVHGKSKYSTPKSMESLDIGKNLYGNMLKALTQSNKEMENTHSLNLDYFQYGKVWKILHGNFTTQLFASFDWLL